MNDKQRRSDERDQRVEVFMDAVAGDFPEGSKGGILAARLKALRGKAATLDLKRGAGTDKRWRGTEAREGARTKLRPMVTTAWDTYKTITLDHPDLKGLFESPVKIKNDQALAAAAHRYADAAATVPALFAEYGLTADFFDDMRAQADSLQAQRGLQIAGVGTSSGANAALDKIQREADKVVERLNTLIRNTYRDDPAKLAEWEGASRVERAPHRKPDEDDENAPPPPANS